MVPDLDKRTKEELMGQIGRLAAAYTPEWRYNRQQPDIGSVLATLFAGLMEECIGCYNQMPQKSQLAFLDALGVEPLPPRPAKGYMTFSLAGGDMPETLAEAGIGVAADGRDGSLWRYETLEDVYVSAATVKLVRDVQEHIWYVGFDRPPNQGVISLLFSMERWGGSGEIRTEWEYLAPGGWHPLPVEDLTDGLSHSGIVRFICMSEWQREERSGTEGFWLRILRDAETPFPCSDARVYINAAEVKAKVSGAAGNLLPGKGYKMTKTVGYVAGVENPDSLTGGTEAEAQERMVTRGSARIRHQFRAVTPGDFERLVYEVCPDVLRVRCFAGYDGRGEKNAGSVTVVVLPADFRESRRYFYKTQELIREYLEAYAEGLLCREGKLYVTQPVPVRIHVQCELCVGSYRRVAEVRRQAEETLCCFLDPLSGNHDGNGWDMGAVPDYEQIKACLLDIPRVEYIEILRIAYEIEQADGYHEALWERLRRHPWILPEMGERKVSVQVTLSGTG